MSETSRSVSRRSPSACTTGRCRSSWRCSSDRKPHPPGALGSGRMLVEVGNRAQAAVESLQQIIRDLIGDVRSRSRCRAGSTSFANSSRPAAVSTASSRSPRRTSTSSPRAGEIVFRALRELLTNVRKHSRATVVELVEPFPPRRSGRDHGRGQRCRAAVPRAAEAPVRGRRFRAVEHRASARRARRSARNRERFRHARDGRGAAQIPAQSSNSARPTTRAGPTSRARPRR